jgi:ribokinase
MSRMSSAGGALGRIAVIGSANFDLVLGVSHRPAPGETVLAASTESHPGGKGANQAVAAARLGARVSFIGCVGGDSFGDVVTASLVRSGVDVSGLRRVAAPTATAVILLTPDGENSIVVSAGANASATTALVDEVWDVWSGAAVLVLQLELPVETVAYAASAAVARGVRVILNAAPATALRAEVLAAADPLVVNENEAATLLGGYVADRDAAEVAAELLTLGVRSVVLTLGARGAVLAESGGLPEHVSGRAVPVVDTTGAGDAFVGALADRIAHGDALSDAVRFANDAAAFSVGRRGTQDSYPRREDVG